MKRLITTIIVLLGVLGFAFVSEHQAQTAQQKRPVVGVLQTLSHPALDQIRKGIIAGLKSEGYVDGKTWSWTLKMPRAIKVTSNQWRISL